MGGGIMKDYVYFIELTTELGVRRGTLLLHDFDRKLTGKLSMLNYDNECIGEMLDEEHCRLHGKIQTILAQMDYMAEGILNPKKIILELFSGRYSYRLEGYAKEQSEL